MRPRMNTCARGTTRMLLLAGFVSPIHVMIVVYGRY